MQFKRSLIVLGITIAALIIAVFVSGTLTAPQPETNQAVVTYKDGDNVSLKGELTCLPHRDQSGPVTLECAYGFLDESGTYYALEDGTEDYSLIANTPMAEQVNVEGVYRTSAESIYQQEGTIRVTAINR